MDHQELERLRGLLGAATAVLEDMTRHGTEPSPRGAVPSAREPLYERHAIPPPTPPPPSCEHPGPISGDIRDAQMRAMAELIREAVPHVAKSADYHTMLSWMERAEILGCRR